MRRRQKSTQACNEDWRNYDDNIWNSIARKTGCKPAHLNINVTLPLCTTKEDMKKFVVDVDSVDEGYLAPCRGIEAFQFDFEDADRDEDEHTPWFGVSAEFRYSTYKEIRQVRAYDFQSLVGNAGKAKH